MAQERIYSRLVESTLIDALEDSPVVLVHGPRQCGKTTLAQLIGRTRGYSYFTFDDTATKEAAESDPIGFVENLPKHTILDEVQRVPALFTTLKASVDRDRIPGRFLLTGSTSVLLVPALSDSLAGRMQILRLHPLAQCEMARTGPLFLERLLSGSFSTHTYSRRLTELSDRVAAGGYPSAVSRKRATRRAAWYRDYVETLIQKDVRDVSRIRSLDVLPRLLSLAASQTARLINISDLASPFQLSRISIREYVTLLERLFLIDELQPWHTNRLSRLVKTPKLHVGDTGLACAVLGLNASGLEADRQLFGQLLETFVLQEMRRQASGQDEDLRFYHFRDRDGFEVDLVLERGIQEVFGIEVKLSATVRSSDFKGLRQLNRAAGGRFKAGVILYNGTTRLPFGNHLFAVPIQDLWNSTF